MAFIEHLHFLRPYAFLLLIPMTFLLWQLHQRDFFNNPWKSEIDPHLLPHLLPDSSQRKNRYLLPLLGFLSFTSVFALAGPAWSQKTLPVYHAQSAKVIVLDLSPSMLAQDIKPDRLSRARYKILDILKYFPEGQTGMTVFSSEAYTVSPLTQDTHTIAAMVPTLSPRIMPVAGSRISAGLEQARQLLEQAGKLRGSILLITGSTPDAADFAVAKKLRQAGDTLSVLALGSETGAPIPDASGGFVDSHGNPVLAKVNFNTLKNLAEAGGGRFSILSDDNQDINDLLKTNFMQQALGSAKKADANTPIWQDEGYWFILLLLPFVLIAFRRGWKEDVFR